MNKTSNAPAQTISDETRNELIEFFRDDLKKTSDLIGRDLSSWYSPL